jgi:hypothetical protein
VLRPLLNFAQAEMFEAQLAAQGRCPGRIDRGIGERQAMLQAADLCSAKKGVTARVDTICDGKKFGEN